MIEAVDLTKTYNGIEVLNIPKLNIGPGEILGVVGNNGAGKTTLFSLLLDLVEATSGHITIKGEDVSKTENWKRFTAAFLDDSFLINFLTPDEYFHFIGSLFNVPSGDVDVFTQEFENIFNGEVLGKSKYIRELSMGNRKKTGLVSTLIGNPEVVIWDEPFSSLDPGTQIKVRNMILAHSQNRTFLISSHDLSHIVEICTRVIVLEKGKIIKDVRKTENWREELFAYFEVS